MFARNFHLDSVKFYILFIVLKPFEYTLRPFLSLNKVSLNISASRQNFKNLVHRFWAIHVRIISAKFQPSSFKTVEVDRCDTWKDGHETSRHFSTDFCSIPPKRIHAKKVSVSWVGGEYDVSPYAFLPYAFLPYAFSPYADLPYIIQFTIWADSPYDECAPARRSPAGLGLHGRAC